MKPTSDRRREVAERLRGYIVYAKKHDLCGDYDMGSGKCVETRCMLYNDIASCIEECGNFNLSAEDVFTRLADLIDPTCEAVHSATSADDELVCSECGATLGAEIDGRQAFVSNFCPCCGARVVSDDD